MYLTEIENGINDQRDMINLIQKIITNKIEIHKVPLIETEPKHYDIIPRIDLFDNNLKLNGNISFHESSKNNLTQVSDENLLIQLKKILSLLHEYKSILNNLELKLLLKWHVLYWCISLNRILEISQIEKKYLGAKNKYPTQHLDDGEFNAQKSLADDIGLKGYLRIHWEEQSNISIFNLDNIQKKINGSDTLNNTINFLLKETSFFNFKTNKYNQNFYNYIKYKDPNLILSFEDYFYITSISYAMKHNPILLENNYTESFLMLKKEQHNICNEIL